MSLLSSIYARITDLRNARFATGRSRSFDLGARTISVGNITAGGTGKTPLVTLIADKLASRGEHVCVLTRGYGRKDPRKRILVSDGTKILADARAAGDEPSEMARALIGKAVVIADRNRVAAAHWANEKFGVSAFVLDDGFQHRRARRDVDIVCIDATDPFGGGKLLPAGRLRERLPNLARATAVMITRADLATNIAEIKAEIRRYNAACPIFTARTVTSRMTSIGDLLDPGNNAKSPGTDLSGLAHSKAFAFCALGNPEAFFGQLRRHNYELAGTQSFRDHYVYGQSDITALTKKALAAGAGYLITTAKDAIKLGGVKFEIPCFVLEIKIVVDDDAHFSELL